MSVRTPRIIWSFLLNLLVTKKTQFVIIVISIHKPDLWFLHTYTQKRVNHHHDTLQKADVINVYYNLPGRSSDWQNRLSYHKVSAWHRLSVECRHCLLCTVSCIAFCRLKCDALCTAYATLFCASCINCRLKSTKYCNEECTVNHRTLCFANFGCALCIVVLHTVLWKSKRNCFSQL